jgi:phage terminase large subunit-like protein
VIAYRHPQDVVDAYVGGVKSGEVVAGRLQRLAVDRYLHDREHAHERGWMFDEDVATRCCAFFPMVCRHSIGEWDGMPFELTPSQMFCVWNIFGWRSCETKYRRFARAYISAARKWGKTTLLAGLALLLEVADEIDGEPCESAAEVYIAATKEDQAKIMYKEAVRMVGASPALKARLRIQKSKPRLIDKKTDGSIVPLGADSPFSGLNPHGVLLDELHEWKERHRPFLGTITSGSGSRRQSLQCTITTAGDDHSQIWIEEYEHAVKVVESVVDGNVIDDREFVWIAEIDADDDPLDPANWPKSNPNYPITPKHDYLSSRAERARVMPTAYNEFVRYHANRRTSSEERIISIEDWAKGAKPITVDAGASCHGAFDLGRSDDWAAVTLCFPVDGKTPDGKRCIDHYEVLHRSFCAKDGRFRVDQEPFRTWIRQGVLHCCDGNQIDFHDVRQQIVEWNRKYRVKTWAHDPTFAGDSSQILKNEHGIECFGFTQAHAFFNVPMRRFVEHEVPQGRIWHGGDPVLAWQAGNLEKSTNPKDQWMPKKNAKRYKIDGMVAALMAFSECLYAEKKPTGSMLVV